MYSSTLYLAFPQEKNPEWENTTQLTPINMMFSEIARIQSKIVRFQGPCLLVFHYITVVNKVMRR